MTHKKKGSGASSHAGRLIPPPGGVVVRMYATGFGDCFLLSFRDEEDQPRYLLIDCGVHTNYEGGKERVQAIARDIQGICNNHLDIVAVTHEHTDHIYGFQYAQDIFRQMSIGELWLAWTEDPANKTAGALRDFRTRCMMALHTAVMGLESAGSPLAAAIRGIHGFEVNAAASEKVRGNKQIMEALRTWYDRQPGLPVTYCVPGNKPLTIPGVTGVRCFVLGPPEDMAAIRKLEDKDEMYFGRQPLSPEKAIMSAVFGMSGNDSLYGEPDISGYPFDRNFTFSKGEAETAYNGFFQNHYGFGKEGREQWRRIDTDWLESAAGDLALNIGSYTNNTSLVLAIALGNGDNRRVLLFPGDAQAGNWLSWQKVSWVEKTGKGEETTDSKTLLGQTILYKTGHHGSSNATMNEKGLEMMKSPDLVALIPVDEVWALDRKPEPWRHPDPKILSELKYHTRGRVLRSDEIPDDGSLIMPKESNEGDWKKFLNNVQWDTSGKKLWIQYTVT